MDTQSPPQLHRIGSVQSRLEMSRSAIYALIESKKLKAVKIGKSIRITEEDLQAFIAGLK